MTQPLTQADTARRRRLVRMKTLAAGLLVLMAVVFAICWTLQDRYPWLGYVRAAAEAGMVGALADWFAVTALFRRPLGLPIPHTAIIPRRKDSIGSALSEFVAANFVSEEVVRDKISRIDVAAKAGAWLAQEPNAERMTKELASAVRGLSSVLSDEQVASLLTQLVRRKVSRTRVGPPIGAVAAGVLERGEHHRLVDFVIDTCFEWMRDNHDVVLRVVTQRAPSWSPRFVDSIVADRVYREVTAFAYAVKSDPTHPLRIAIDRFLGTLARDLQVDPETMDRADRIARRLVANEQVQQVAASAWTGAKETLLQAAEDPDSPLRRSVRDGLVAFGRRLTTDKELAGKIDAWIADAAGYLAANHARALTGIIDDTIGRWDGEQTSRRIELHIGRDLQFIRINGTVVGALAGLAIYSVAQLVLG